MEDISFKELVKALKNEDGRKIVANYGLDPKLGKYHRIYCDACNSIILTIRTVRYVLMYWRLDVWDDLQ